MFNAHKHTDSIPRPTRRRSILHAASLAAVALAAAACGGGADDDAADEVPAPADTPAVGGQIATAQTEIGEVLTDPTGLTLYGFIDDVEGVSTCFDTCETAWPPVDGDLAVAAALDGAGFDTISRPDGTEQMRVGGRWPLYTFAGDAGPGDVNGQESGGVWFAVAPDGTLVGLDGDAPAEAGAADDAAGDGPDDGSGDPAPGDDDEEGVADAEGGVDTDLGRVLTDGEGRTIYAFANDSAGVSNCNDPCSATWPPVADLDGISPQLDGLALIARDDGSEQVALDGLALYTYIDDVAPGDVTGQGIGDVWFAVAADGEVLTPPAVRVGSTDSGDVLIDDDGFALYVFANDEPGVSNCLDPCQSTWPPVAGDTRIDPALDPDQFGEMSRNDGTTQLTLDGRPLYTFTGDTNPGDTNGVSVGTPGTWSVIAADEIVPGAYPDAATTAAPADITIGETSLGAVATTSEGLTLYAFLDDTPTESTCTGACADAWPPIEGDPVTDPAISATIATIERSDGTTQTVIGEWPAYTFAGDAGPGDVFGQGSGDVWFAIAPDGTLLR